MDVRIKIKIKDIEIDLSEKEAGELKDILERLTGPTRPAIEKEIVPYPVPVYPDPYPIYPPTPWWYYYDCWTVTADNTHSDPQLTITALYG